jgi:hypothetical protein
MLEIAFAVALGLLGWQGANYLVARVRRPGVWRGVVQGSSQAFQNALAGGANVVAVVVVLVLDLNLLKYVFSLPPEADARTGKR